MANNSIEIAFISDKLKTYYEDLAKIKSNKKQIIKEFLTLNDEEISADFDISLTNMINTYISYSKDNPEVLLEEINEKKKNFKKYLHRLIKQDYEGVAEIKGNPLFLSKECASYGNIIRTGATIGGHETVDSLKENRYETVKAWNSDTTRDCSDFVYFLALKPKRRITSVITDIKYHCLMYLIEATNSDDAKGQRLIIDTAYEAPIFNATKAKMNVKIAREEDYITAYDSYRQGHTEVKTTIEKHKIEDSTAMAVIDEMRQVYQTDNMPPALDASDLILLSCVCSAIKGENIASGTLTIPLKSIYSEYNGETTRFRKYEYRQLLKKIENLAKYSLELSRFIPESKTFEHKILHFFDFSYDLPVKDSIFKDMDNIDNIDEIDDDDIDFSNCVTRFRLGDTILDAWQQQKVMQVSADGFNCLPSSKSKAFLFYLEGKRIKAYPESESFISFSDIKNSLRFDKKVRFKTEIKNMLDIFSMSSSKDTTRYDKAKMILSYEMKINGVAIKFKPFTDHEIKTYKLDKPIDKING